MTKLTIVAIVATLAFTGRASPVPEDSAIMKAAETGDWDQVSRLLQKSVHDSPPQLSPSPHGRYYSQSEYQYSKAINDNGKISKDEGGLGVIDDNGKKTYYQPTGKQLFMPTFDLPSGFKGFNSNEFNNAYAPINSGSNNSPLSSTSH